MQNTESCLSFFWPFAAAILISPSTLLLKRSHCWFCIILSLFTICRMYLTFCWPLPKAIQTLWISADGGKVALNMWKHWAINKWNQWAGKWRGFAFDSRDSGCDLRGAVRREKKMEVDGGLQCVVCHCRFQLVDGTVRFSRQPYMSTKRCWRRNIKLPIWEVFLIFSDNPTQSNIQYFGWKRGLIGLNMEHLKAHYHWSVAGKCCTLITPQLWFQLLTGNPYRGQNKNWKENHLTSNEVCLGLVITSSYSKKRKNIIRRRLMVPVLWSNISCAVYSILQ